jgi:hypothetical protein
VFILFSVLTGLLTMPMTFGQATVATADPLEQRVVNFELKADTLGDALGRLNQSINISISIEGVLPQEGTVTNPKFTAKSENRTVAQILDWLCNLDTRYGWSRDGNNVNVFPRNSSSDPDYFFDRKISNLHFEQLRKVADAVLAVNSQSGDRGGGVIYMGIGQAQSFTEAWTASFTDITVRQALNRIAQHLGPTYGWQIGGTTKARLIVFYYRLEAQHVNVSSR